MGRFLSSELDDIEYSVLAVAKAGQRAIVHCGDDRYKHHAHARFDERRAELDLMLAE